MDLRTENHRVRRSLIRSMRMVAAIVAVVSATGSAADYLGPSDLIVSPDGDTLYVACADAQSVLWVDLPSGRVQRRVAVAAKPTDLLLTPDGSRLIIICSAPHSTVEVRSAQTGKMLATIPAGHTATGSALGPEGSRLYVCNRFDSDLSVIDLESGEEIKRVPMVREPVAAAATPDGDTVFVANHLANMRTDVSILDEVTPQVSVLDTRTFETAEIELPSGSHSLRDVTLSHDGNHAFVTHLLANFQMIPFRVDTGWINTNVISIIDARGRRLISTIGLDQMDRGAANPWGVACTSDGEFVCVTQSGNHQLAVIDRQVLLSEESRRAMSPMMTVWPIYPGLGESFWKRVPLPGKGPRAVATAGSTAYVAEYFSDSVSVVDLRNPDRPPSATIRLGPTPSMSDRRRGELLFHDATLCYQQWQSCASCHPDGRSDALAWDLLNDGPGNPKNTKSLLLSHRTPPAMAEGVRASGAEAVRSGVINILFAHRPEIETARLDAYLEALTPVPSPHLVSGGLSESARRGRDLFDSAQLGCRRCHPAPLFTDLKMHDVGTRNLSQQNRRFDTPTLIEVWRTAPYLHDGRYTTIKQLLQEGKHGLRQPRARTLTAEQLDDLCAFVLSL